MNSALSDVLLANPPKAIFETDKLIHMKQPNTIFLHIFDWFITKYRQITIEDCEGNQQRTAATWRPYNSFEPLVMRLFIGTS
jgi:hypothetical protein